MPCRFRLTLLLISFFHLVLLAQPTFTPGTDPKPPGKKWVPVPELSDEFKGRTVDLSKWQIEPMGNDWTWIGRPPGLFQAKNVSIRKGRLSVEVGVLPEQKVIQGDTFTHYGGIVRSLRPGTHGMYFEARMKANRTEMSSTFWLMSKYDCEQKQELDIQECVGVVSPEKADWVKDWDQIFHSNAIHRRTECNPEPTQIQGQMTPEEKNWEGFHVYGCWWKSPDELRFYFDGDYAYSIKPSIGFNMPAFIQMAIETYDWNPIPDDGGAIKGTPKKYRRTEYDWVRVWRLE
ncbi:MAG: family 16 glycosylhydrolase [Bacteroidota bacterium]